MEIPSISGNRRLRRTKRPVICTLLLAAVSLIITSCAKPPAPADNYTDLPPVQRNISTPSVGVIAEREVGETIIADSSLLLYRGVEFLAPVEYTHATIRFRISAGQRFTENRAANGQPMFCGKADAFVPATPKANGEWGQCFFLVNGVLLTASDSAPLNVSPGANLDFHLIDIVVPTERSIERRILYSGRTGDRLLLSYREFREGLARPAFTQDVVFDLSKGREIGFRGARFEIINASNTSVRYRLLRAFPDLEN